MSSPSPFRHRQLLSSRAVPLCCLALATVTALRVSPCSPRGAQWGRACPYGMHAALAGIPAAQQRTRSHVLELLMSKRIPRLHKRLRRIGPNAAAGVKLPPTGNPACSRSAAYVAGRWQRRFCNDGGGIQWTGSRPSRPHHRAAGSRTCSAIQRAHSTTIWLLPRYPASLKLSPASTATSAGGGSPGAQGAADATVTCFQYPRARAA